MAEHQQKKRLQSKRKQRAPQGEDLENASPSSESEEVVHLQQFVGNSGVQNLMNTGKLDTPHSTLSRFIDSKNTIQRDLKENLNEAMDGWGTDENAIHEAIASATPEEKLAVLNDPGMLSRLSGELGQEDMLRALNGLNAPLKLKLEAAMNGWGTDEAAIMSLTAGATSEEKQAVLDDTALVQRLGGELSQEDMVAVLSNLNAPLKLKLEAAMDGWGTDEATILSLTANATAEEKQAVLSDTALVQRLAGELSQQDMLTVLNNLNAPLILKLNTAMDGWGTDEQTIFSLISSATAAEKQAALQDTALIQRLVSELSGREALQILVTLEAPLEMRLNVAMDGWGTDEAMIQEILASAQPAERDALLNTPAVIARLHSELSLADMIAIMRSSNVPFKRIVELAFDPWNADLDGVRTFISAATDAECETVWSDDPLMSSIQTKLGDDVYLDFLVVIRMHRPGVTAEDGESHIEASEADEAIQEHLADYIEGALRDGRQISGMVAVVGDDEWDLAGIAHYGESVWNGGKSTSINGFVDRQDRVWIHRERGNAGTMIHEAVHKYSTDALRDECQPLNEGVTEYFARKVCAALSPPLAPNRLNYEKNYNFTVELVNITSEATVAAAFFDGDVDGLKNAVNNATGDDTSWDTIVAHIKESPSNWTDAKTALTTVPATP